MSVVPTIVRKHWLWHLLSQDRVARPRHAQPTPLLARNERVLARARNRESSPVLGSDRALYLGAGQGWRRVDWAEVSAVRSGADRPMMLRLWSAEEISVDTDRAFALFVAERVASTRLLCRRVPIPGGTAVVTAVRAPHQEEVTWRVQLDSGDPETDEARLAIRRLLTELRGLAGC